MPPKRQPPKPPVADLDKLKPFAGSTWTALRAFFKKYSYLAQHEWSPYRGTHEIRAKFQGRDVLLSLGFDQAIGGEVTQAIVYTAEVAPGELDPANGFDVALRIEWNRADHPEGEAYIGLISAKPSHGVPTGDGAVQLATTLCRLVNTKTARLRDASHKACAGTGDELPLRRARILSKGSGWYESMHFRSLLEAIEPALFAKHVPALRSIRTTELIRVCEAWDGLLRRAILNKSLDEGKLRARLYEADGAEPSVRAITLQEGIALLLRMATASRLLSDARQPTLGETMEHLVDADCAAAAKLVAALLPSTDATSEFVVQLTDGRRTVALPKHESWGYTWHLQQDVNLRIRIPAGKGG